MKVAYLLNIFPKISETFILNEMLAVQSQGVEVEIFSYKDEKEPVVHPGVKLIKKPYYFQKYGFFRNFRAHLYWLFKKPARYFKTVWLILNHGKGIRKMFLCHLDDTVRVASLKPDHLHAHYGSSLGDLASSDLAMVTSSLSGIPYSFTTHMHDIYDMPPMNYPIKSKLAKKHVTISEFNKKYLVENFGIKPEYISVIHCGVDMNRIPKRSFNASSRLILSVARLHPDKALLILVKACARLKEEGVSFECKIIGEGPERPVLEECIKSLGLEKEVQLLGHQTQEQVFVWLSRARLFVLPSYSEGIPVSLMEAMASHIPVVSTQIRGIPELIEDGKSGFLVEPGDQIALAQAVKKLLHQDQLSGEFSERGYEKVAREFDLFIEAKKLNNLWREK